MLLYIVGSMYVDVLTIDEKHPKFRGKVLCSAGIGSGYLKREDAKKHVYIPVTILGLLGM